MKSQSIKSSRRRFLSAAAGAMAAPAFVPSRVLGKDGAVAPSNQITMGTIGFGGMGKANTDNFMKFDDCRFLAVCDVDQRHSAQGVAHVNKHYGNSDCLGYVDFRPVLQRNDIDAVCVATPDHWHGYIAVAAANAGKDVYGEKPVAHSIGEGRAIADAAKKNGRVWQTGSWQRSVFNFRLGAMLVRNGYIGKVRRVEVGLPLGYFDLNGSKGIVRFSEPPASLDYEMWQGPAAARPYSPTIGHANWRWNYAYGGGQIGDWGGHHIDIAHWGMDRDTSGPTQVEAKGDLPPPHAVWNTSPQYRVTCEYEGGVELVIAGTHSGYEGYPQHLTDLEGDPRILGGTKWIGDDGWVRVDRGKFEASDMKWTRLKDDQIEGNVRLDISHNHWRNFLDCVKSRRPTLTPAETAHRSITPGYLGVISLLTGRKVHWDPITERIVNDPGAAQLLHAPMREPWRVG